MFCTDPWRLCAEAPGWMLARLAGGPSITFLRHRSALGDCLMVTPLARALKQWQPQLRVAIVSRRPDLFAGNPHFDENRGWHLWRTRHTVQAGYHRTELTTDEHVVEIQWRNLWQELSAEGFDAGTSGTVPPLCGLHPDLVLEETELERGREMARLIRETCGRSREAPLILISSGGKLKPTHNREWGSANYQALVEALHPHASLAQVGGDEPLRAKDKPLPDFGALPVRQAAALFAAADALLVQEGGLMHLARAVQAPTLVIYGGYVLPQQTGYPEQVNLWARPDCSPCIGLGVDCPHLKCMVGLTPARVLEALSDLAWTQHGRSIPQGLSAGVPGRWQPPPFVDRTALEAELAKGTSLNR